MATLNLSTAKNMFIEGREASSLYLPRLGKIWEHPYAYQVHSTAGTMYYNIPIPLWCNTVYFEMIGGGGGGQTGNGTNGASGVPGRGATWIQQGYNLNRADGETYVYNYYVGKGGAGGTNSDHSAGQDGEMSEVTIMRKRVGVPDDSIATLSSTVLGKGGPASGLSQGATSGGVSSKNSVRNYIQLPSAAGVAKEIVGNSPGGGGGYGGGGFFGARGTGRAGGNGRIYAFFLGDRV